MHNLQKLYCKLKIDLIKIVPSLKISSIFVKLQLKLKFQLKSGGNGLEHCSTGTFCCTVKLSENELQGTDETLYRARNG